MSADLTANTAWIHVLCAMVREARWTKLSTTAAKTWVTLRGSADMRTGYVDLGQAELARQVGLSLATIDRAVRELVESKYIEVQRLGRKNRYVMRDRVGMVDVDGVHQANAELQYVPLRMQKLLAEIQAAAKGQAPINITINFVAGDQINVVVGDHQPSPDASHEIEAIVAAVRAGSGLRIAGRPASQAVIDAILTDGHSAILADSLAMGMDVEVEAAPDMSPSAPTRPGGAGR